MSRKHHVMLDIETLDSSDTAAVVSIGAVKMNYSTLEISEEYQCIFSDLDGQLELGRTKNEDTMKWWANLPTHASEPLFYPELFGEILRTTKEGLTELSEFCKNCYVWGYGSMFDNVIIRSIMRDYSVKPLWHYRDDMCARTLINVFPMASNIPRVGTHHNALDDARTQMNWLREIIITKDLPIRYME